MINVTVINIKSLTRYIIIALVLICIVLGIKVIVKQVNMPTNKVSSILKNANFISCVEKTLPNIKEDSKIQKLEEDAKKVTSRGSSLRRMLSVELGMMDTLIEDNEEEGVIESSIEETEQVAHAETDVQTTQVQENNITPKYNLEYGTVKVKNESKKEITADTLTPNITLENKKDVVIFHTHTCESYTPTENFNYQASGSYRTTDLNYSVARVGKELEKK